MSARSAAMPARIRRAAWAAVITLSSISSGRFETCGPACGASEAELRRKSLHTRPGQITDTPILLGERASRIPKDSGMTAILVAAYRPICQQIGRAHVCTPVTNAQLVY